MPDWAEVAVSILMDKRLMTVSIPSGERCNRHLPSSFGVFL